MVDTGVSTGVVPVVSTVVDTGVSTGVVAVVSSVVDTGVSTGEVSVVSAVLETYFCILLARLCCLAWLYSEEEAIRLQLWSH